MLDDNWLAERLVAEGLTTQAKVDSARSGPDDLCRGLITSGALDEASLLRFLGLHHQTRYVSTEKLSSAKVIQWVLDLLSLEFCEKYQVLPIRCDKQRTTLSVVTPDPSDQTVIEETKRRAGVQEVMAYVSLPHAIEAGIRKFYRGDLHAFARMDESLRQNYSEMLNIYEQRLIDFGEGAAPPAETEANNQPPQFRYDEPVLDTEDVSSPTTPPPTASPGSRKSSPGLPSPPLQLEGLLQVVQVLASELERGHGWWPGHATEVTKLATQLATKAGLMQDELPDLQLAALVHELGKPVDTHLTLLSIEANNLRQKAIEAYNTPSKLLASAKLAPDVMHTLATLYEQSDGAGVPGQLSGDALPLTTRVLQVADAFCDLVGNPDAPGGRCSPDAAAKRLEEAAGRGLFDHVVVGQLAALKGGAPGRSGDRPLVLIIDEDPRSAALLEGQLKSSGFDAIVAGTTGDAALVLLGEKVSLVLSEVDLKPMDGFTFLEWLRSNQRTQSIPFMFVSGRAGADDVNRGFELGAIDYIVKPFRPEVVLAKVKRSVPA